ncbi:MAG: DUF167 domain-containing protein [Gammaproteobacteria bacterium]|jgi:hypothetical protein
MPSSNTQPKENPSYSYQKGDDLYLQVHINPGAKKSAIVGPYGDRLKIKIAAPPLDNKANLELVKFLAKHFDVPTKQVEILQGKSGRDKLVRIEGKKRKL